MENLSTARCLVCDLPFERGEDFCRNILCQNKWFKWNYAIAMRSGFLQKAINQYKFDNRENWALIFARVLVGFLEEESYLFSGFDLIVASPTFVSQHGTARRWDHTRRVIYKANEECYGEWPFDVGVDAPAILKTAQTPRMTARPWKERYQIAQTDLRNALLVPNPATTEGKSILVYDDIFTDGMTLNEVARCLRKQGGATEVCGVTLARQPWIKR